MGGPHPKTWRRHWQPTPVLLPGKSHGWRSLVGCSPWGHEESDTTERLHFHFSLSCIREGNGNPLQCSCLENPRDDGARWAAVSGVAQSRTRLKRLSSSSSSSILRPTLAPPASPREFSALSLSSFSLASYTVLLEAEPLSPVPDCEPLEGKDKLFITSISPSPGTSPSPSLVKKFAE